MKNKWPLFAALAVGGLIVGGFFMARTLRGLRNNNPGNIKRTPRNDVDGSDPWLGLLSLRPNDPGFDPVFFQFVSPFYGLRAMFRILLHYRSDRNSPARTVRDYISRWLGNPSSGVDDSGNSVASYVQYVADALGLKPDDALPPARLVDLAQAITRRENSRLNPYARTDYETALAAALEG